MRTKHEVTKEILAKYLKAGRAEKGAVLDTFCAMTKYNRKYAITKLREFQLTPALTFKVPGKHRRARERVYGGPERVALETIRQAVGGICAERLHPYLQEIVAKLITCGELRVESLTEMKLLSMSLSTLKRLMSEIDLRGKEKTFSTTRPGVLLKSEIPLRVGLWQETEPGFLEIDLVAHCGDTAQGHFGNTLDSTDIATGWFEAEAVMGKAEERVLAGIMAIRKRLPFALAGIDSDNGGEFINRELFGYCQRQNIIFTRSRAYEKNDNAHIEQKNWTCVRRIMGYQRIEDERAIKLMNELYRGPLRDFINFFQPSMKYIEKKRVGAKIVKRYDKARTPYQRVLESKSVSSESKEKLGAHYANLNPMQIRRKIDILLDKIGKLTVKRA